jgi:hypothetical protein
MRNGGKRKMNFSRFSISGFTICGFEHYHVIQIKNIKLLEEIYEAQ